MAENTIQIPSGFGGLMRFKEEYESKIILKPIHVIAMIIFVIILRVSLEFIF
ncbi:MAG: hypothetical protein QXX55_01045 [Candidatus Pacearchaeota archaeon]